MEGERDRYVPSHERQKTKDSDSSKSKYILSCILDKVEGSDKILKEMKEDVLTLS